MKGSLKDQLEEARPEIELGMLDGVIHKRAEDLLDKAIEKAVMAAAAEYSFSKEKAADIMQRAQSTYRSKPPIL